MKRSPDCKPKLWDGAVVLLVLLLAAGTAAATWGGGSSGQLTAVVAIDGETVDRFPLSGSGAHTYEAGGYTVLVEETEKGVLVAKSNCPTQDCVHTGTISRPGQSIVCLPARLSVTLEGGGEGPEVDAVIG